MQKSRERAPGLVSIPVKRLISRRARAPGGGRRRQGSRIVRQGAEIGDDVGALFRVRLAREAHLGAGDKSLRAGDEAVEVLVGPVAALGLHGVGIGEAGFAALGAADDAVKVGPDLRARALFEIVAGRADLGQGFAFGRVGLGEQGGQRNGGGGRRGGLRGRRAARQVVAGRFRLGEVTSTSLNTPRPSANKVEPKRAPRIR